MTADPASLGRLHDIVVPPPVSWWPPAPGWLLLFCFAALAILMLILRGVIHWQQNRYRREALAELARLEASAGNAGSPAGAVAGMSKLLKRTAITAYGREQVASLTGTEWFAFLDRTGGTQFSSGLGAALEEAIYRPGAENQVRTRMADAAGEVRQWIRAHKRQHEVLPTPGARGGDAAPPAADRKAA